MKFENRLSEKRARINSLLDQQDCYDEEEYTCREMEVFQHKDYFKGIPEDKLHLFYIEKIKKNLPNKPSSKFNHEKFKLKEVKGQILNSLNDPSGPEYHMVDWEFYFAVPTLEKVIQRAKQIAKNKGFELCETSSKCLYTGELQLQCTRADKECLFRLIYHHNDIIKKYEMHECYLIHNHTLDIQKTSKFNLATKRVAKKTYDITEVEGQQNKPKVIPIEMLNLEPVPEPKIIKKPEDTIKEAINQALRETLKDDIKDDPNVISVNNHNNEGELILFKEKPFPCRVENIEDLLKGNFWTAYIKMPKE